MQRLNIHRCFDRPVAVKRNEREEPSSNRFTLLSGLWLFHQANPWIDRSIVNRNRESSVGKEFCDRYSRRGFVGIRWSGREAGRETTRTMTVFESFRIAIRKWWPRQQGAALSNHSFVADVVNQQVDVRYSTELETAMKLGRFDNGRINFRL